jgi:uncharacterized protein YuzE
MIHLTYDANVRAMYIGMSQAVAAAQEEWFDGLVVVDRAAGGALVGIEVAGELTIDQRRHLVDELALDALVESLLGRYGAMDPRVSGGVELARG